VNLFGVVAFVAGAVLMYSAVKSKDPRDVVLEALGRKAKFGDLGVGKAGQFAEPRSGFGSAVSTVPAGVTWTNV
jgi:hypothetical protein